VLEGGPASGPPPIVVKDAIRSVMWERMDYIKNETKMRTALAELADIRQNLVPRMTVASKTRNYNYDWVDGLDGYNMLDACVLTISASVHRRESRGPFYREDCPLQDNSNWLRFIILGGTLGDIRIREQPIELPASVPPGTTDFFSTIEP
jgi:succinate dehydrogenase/fumarate reductase flavoprotein subunit